MELAQREGLLRNGRLTTILFIRCIANNKNKSEISGYIDLAHRMKTEDFRPIFMKDEVLMPRTSDLSYFSFESQSCHLNDSSNFRTDANSEEGLMFRNKRDRKLINVNPSLSKAGDFTDRTELENPGYPYI